MLYLTGRIFKIKLQRDFKSCLNLSKDLDKLNKTFPKCDIRGYFIEKYNKGTIISIGVNISFLTCLPMPLTASVPVNQYLFTLHTWCQ